MTHTASRRRSALALFALAVLALGACGGQEDEPTAGGDSPSTTAAPGADKGGDESAAGEATDKVEVKGFRFQPQTIKVAPGTKVTWTFLDSADHTVESREEGLFESEELADGKTFEHTFEKAGSFEYFCGIHTYMEGTVVVG